MKNKIDNASTAEYDYSEYSKDRRFHGRILSNSQREELRQLSDLIAEKFKLPKNESHFDLLLNLSKIMDTRSEVALKNGKVIVPIDQPPFKATNEEILIELCRSLLSAANLMPLVIENETFAEVLHFTDEDGKLDQHFESLLALAEVAKRIQVLKGRSGTRPNQDWIKDFCITSQKYWFEHKNKRTRITLHTEHKTPISLWVLELYKSMVAFKDFDVDNSKLATAAKYLPAYRP